GARKQIPVRPKRQGTTVAEARSTQSPPIFRSMALEALKSWVMPTLSLTAATLFWLMSAIDVWSEPVAVVGVAGSLLVLALFASPRQCLFAEDSVRRYVSLGFGCLWGFLLFITFYVDNFPGAASTGGVLRPGGEAISLPAGAHALVVDGRFVATQGQGNRLGH